MTIGRKRGPNPRASDLDTIFRMVLVINTELNHYSLLLLYGKEKFELWREFFFGVKAV